jgi:uroporphyrin-III C-methyltransferase
MIRPGVVYLVGAGPGDPGLITVRGLECLRRAEVVVYDRLVDRALLDEAPITAERIYAGKAPGREALRQEEINLLLIKRARLGRVVIRLKGGDPFVFGRGGEEALACAAAGVTWEVVPGVSSALGVPACAGIPLTHRGVSGSFAVVTGHRVGSGRDDGGEDGLDWAALAAIDTLVILMGVGRLQEISASLIRHGRSPDTPAAIIERGTEPEQRVIKATLADLAVQARRAGVQPPATVVIGAVAGLRDPMLGAARVALEEGLGGRTAIEEVTQAAGW